MKRKEIKKLAKTQLKNNLVIMILLSLIIILPFVAFACLFEKDVLPFIIGNGLIIISAGSVVLSNASLKIVRDNKIKLKDALDVLKNVNKVCILDCIKYLVIMFFVMIFTIPLTLGMMWAMFVSYDFVMLAIICLIYILMIILTYCLASVFISQKNYLISDLEDIATFNVISKNFSLLRKNIFKYIKFELSFLGWFILSILTCGIGFILLIPYRQICLAHFYENIKEDKLSDYKKSKTPKIVKIIIPIVIVLVVNVIGYKYYAQLSKEEYMESMDYTYIGTEIDANKKEEADLDEILKEEEVFTMHNSQICRIISNLEGNLYFSNFESIYYRDHSKTEDKIKVHYSANEVLGLDDYMEFWNEKDTKRILLDNATVLMAMADDMKQVEFVLDEKEDKTYIFTREELNKIYKMDISKLKKDKKLFKEKLNQE
ncbi:MAG: DUF975 family protein [Terrisporobacter sp.]|uniref:DUF975 family protein n=1 Tax=Terrisporobacter sp. TaxID=1965305 RepID=UPI002FC85ABC